SAHRLCGTSATSTTSRPPRSSACWKGTSLRCDGFRQVPAPGYVSAMLTQVSSGTFTRALTDGSWGSFPFGCLNLRRPATTPTSGAAKVAVLGVYPSALHVEWTAPDASTHIAALAVDVEPEVFWKGDGDDPDELLERWKATARVNVS